MPAEPQPVAMAVMQPPAPPPLDLAALETAVAGAATALDDLQAVDPEQIFLVQLSDYKVGTLCTPATIVVP